MREYLLFHLYGPMSSWGDIAVGEYRPTFAHPTKSAILGLLAAAKGILRENPDRTENEIHRRMAESYGFAVCVQAPGLLVRDYHTIQTPPNKKDVAYYTRKQELSYPKNELNTILSTRDYRCDGLYVVCIWCINSNPPFPLDDPEGTKEQERKSLKCALEKPCFVLYLGRKSCPPSLPLEPQIRRADNVRKALKNAKFKFDCLLEGFEKEDTFTYHWEGKSDEGFEHDKIQTIVRRDVPLSRRRWQFEEREEHLAMLESEA